METVTTPVAIADPEVARKMLEERITAETRPMTVRQMTATERAVYPPLRPTKADMQQCIEEGLALDEIAKRFEVTPERVARLAGVYNLAHAIRRTRHEKPAPIEPKVADLMARFPKEKIIAAIREHRSSKAAAKALHIKPVNWCLLIKAYNLQTGPGHSILEAVGEKRPVRRRGPGRAIGVAIEADKPEQTPRQATNVAGGIAHLLHRLNEAGAANSPGDLTASEQEALNELTVFIRRAVAEPLRQVTDDLHSHGHDFFAIGPARFKGVAG